MVEIGSEQIDENVKIVVEFDYVYTNDGVILKFDIKYYSNFNVWGKENVLVDSFTYFYDLSFRALARLGIDPNNIENAIKEKVNNDIEFEDDLKDFSRKSDTISLRCKYITKSAFDARTIVNSVHDLDAVVNKTDYSTLFDNFDPLKDKKIEMAYRALVKGEDIQGYFKDDYYNGTFTKYDLAKIFKLHEKLLCSEFETIKLNELKP